MGHLHTLSWALTVSTYGSDRPFPVRAPWTTILPEFGMIVSKPV